MVKADSSKKAVFFWPLHGRKGEASGVEPCHPNGRRSLRALRYALTHGFRPNHHSFFHLSLDCNHGPSHILAKTKSCSAGLGGRLAQTRGLFLALARTKRRSVGC